MLFEAQVGFKPMTLTLAVASIAPSRLAITKLIWHICFQWPIPSLFFIICVFSRYTVNIDKMLITKISDGCIWESGTLMSDPTTKPTVSQSRPKSVHLFQVLIFISVLFHSFLQKWAYLGLFFALFLSFYQTIQILVEKSVDVGLGNWTWGHRMIRTDGSNEQWRLPYFWYKTFFLVLWIETMGRSYIVNFEHNFCNTCYKQSDWVLTFFKQ